MNKLLLEASNQGNPFFSKTIDQLVTTDGETLFPDIFQLEDCEALRSYEDLNDFVLGITGFMMDSIDPFDLLVVTSVKKDGILSWSIEIRLNGTEISLRTIDWSGESCVYRHEEQ